MLSTRNLKEINFENIKFIFKNRGFTEEECLKLFEFFKTLNYNSNDYNVVEGPVDSLINIAQGDLVYLNTDDIRSAPYMSDAGNEIGNQITFHDSFLGVALESVIGPGTVKVATSGRHKFSCLSADFEIGDLIGADENSGGTFLEARRVAKVSSTAAAIGRTVTRGTGLTEIEVEIVSTVMFGGPMPA